MLYGPRDVRFEDRPDPVIVEPTDAIIPVTATGTRVRSLLITLDHFLSRSLPVAVAKEQL